jgi:hypothetical protein
MTDRDREAIRDAILAAHSYDRGDHWHDKGIITALNRGAELTEQEEIKVYEACAKDSNLMNILDMNLILDGFCGDVTGFLKEHLKNFDQIEDVWGDR